MIAVVFVVAWLLWCGLLLTIDGCFVAGCGRLF